MNLSVLFKSLSLSLSKNIIDESMSMGFIQVPEPYTIGNLIPPNPILIIVAIKVRYYEDL